MKILCGALEPSSGNVSKEKHERMAYLRQDQFAYEDQRVLDVVLMGHAEMWACMSERDAIYANPTRRKTTTCTPPNSRRSSPSTTATRPRHRAGELLLGVGIPIEKHNGPMSEVAPGWKLRVLLVQALFANPDILLLDEPTNNLDINTIRWLEDVLNNRESTMIIISHDRHFLNQVCTRTGPPTTARSPSIRATTTTSWKPRRRRASGRPMPTPRPRSASPNCRPSSAASANASKAAQATSPPEADRQDEAGDVKPSSRQYPWIRFEVRREGEAASPGGRARRRQPRLRRRRSTVRRLHGDRRCRREGIAIIGENGVGKTTLLRCLAGRSDAQPGT